MTENWKQGMCQYYNRNCWLTSIGKSVLISGAAMSGEKGKQISTQIIYCAITTKYSAILVVQSDLKQDVQGLKWA